MARTWPSIQAGLIEGAGEHRWLRPGWILAPTHTFAQLALAIDDALTQWGTRSPFPAQ